jgi:hypothetical protein
MGGGVIRLDAGPVSLLELRRGASGLCPPPAARLARRLGKHTMPRYLEPHADYSLGLERWRMWLHELNGLPAGGSYRSVSRVMWPPNHVWSCAT